jgi:hypothetical protein
MGTAKFRFTKSNAYSGNNGRAAILGSQNIVYTSGNAGTAPTRSRTA